MRDNQGRINDLNAIKLSVLSLRAKLNSPIATVVQSAMEEYATLVDHFYRANELLMAPQQYDVAKKDFDYFIRLVDLAIQYTATKDRS